MKWNSNVSVDFVRMQIKVSAWGRRVFLASFLRYGVIKSIAHDLFMPTVSRQMRREMHVL